MTRSVASVTIAYNAEHSLPRQLDALLSQSHQLQEIIVVDNASTDGTSSMLSSCYPDVTVISTTENLGAAGGWARGLAYAATKGHDWIWTFDDDTVPELDCLQNLLNGIHQLETTYSNLGIATCLAFNRATGKCYKPVYWREGFVNPPDSVLSGEAWFADLVIASGCMVKREVIDTIGLPRDDFFMDVFDFEYCLRAKSFGFSIAVINRAHALHEIGNTREIRLPGYSRSWMKQPPWREYYISRNLFHLAWRLYPTFRTKISITRYLLVHAVQIALFGSLKADCLKKMAQGVSDGHRALLGARFRPVLSPRDETATPCRVTH